MTLLYLAALFGGCFAIGWHSFKFIIGVKDAGWRPSRWKERRALYAQLVDAVRRGHAFKTDAFLLLADYRVILPNGTVELETFDGGVFSRCGGFEWYQPTRLKWALRGVSS